MWLYVAVGLPLFFIVLTTIVGRIEKRMVWPYGPPQPHPQFPDASGFLARKMNDAFNAGFGLLGWCADQKGANYKMSYGMMISPERDCFVIIGVGTILNMNVRGVTIYSCANDGKVIYSTDHQSAVEFDMSRLWRSQLVPDSTFPKLLNNHRETVKHLGFVSKSFTVGRELEEFKAVREERFRRMAKQGFIAFLPGSPNEWRYTTLGAFKQVFLNYWIGTARSLTAGNYPKVV